MSLDIIFQRIKEINYYFFRYLFNYRTTRELLGIRKYKPRKPKNEIY